MISVQDLEALFRLDNELRKKFGVLRYFLFPLYSETGREMALRLRYVDRRDYLSKPRPVCRADCPECDHCNPVVNSALPAAANWTSETLLRYKDYVHVVLGQTRYRFSPKFGMFPSFHPADGLVNVVGLNGASSPMAMLRGVLHHFNWLPDDFVIEDSSPFHIATDELLVESAMDAEKKLYVSMEEANYNVGGSLHFKVGWI